MKCRKCGNELSRNLKFCNQCGEPVKREDMSDQVPQDTPVFIHCPKCGNQVNSANRFCTICGCQLSRELENETVYEGVYTPPPYESYSSEPGDIPEYHGDPSGGSWSDSWSSGGRDYDSRGTGRKKNGSSMLIGIAALAIALIALIGGLFIVFRLNDGDDEPAETGEMTLESEELDPVNSGTGERVNLVKEKCKVLKSAVDAGQYMSGTTTEGETIWYDSAGNIQCAIVPKGNASSKYTRTYYFDENGMYFAYYEGNDSHRFYFDNNEMIRWRYYPDSSNSNEAVNHDMEDTEEYARWAKQVAGDAADLKFRWDCGSIVFPSEVKDVEPTTSPYVAPTTAAQTYGANSGSVSGDYILPSSNSSYISSSQLYGLTEWQVRVALNEIYARHGRKFKDDSLQKHFNSCSWYRGTIAPADFNENVFNKYEEENVKTIAAYQKSMGWR